MTEDVPRPRPRFKRVPRPSIDAPPAEFSWVKFRDSLDAIETLLHHAVVGGKDAFTRDSPPYASGSMVIIRMAALFETDEFSAYVGATPEDARRGIVKMRNIASHGGYRAMDDDIFWTTLTTRVPPLLAEWRAAAGE